MRNGYKKTEIGVIPLDWEVVRLGDIATKITSGGTPSRSKEEYFKNGTVNWLKTGELRDCYIYDAKEKITEEAIKKSSAKIFPIDTLLIAMYGATIGQTAYLKTECSTNQACCAIMFNKEIANSFFYWKYFYFIKDSLIGLGRGAGQPNISQGIIKELKIPLPPLTQQKKIAKILSTTDNKIEAITKQIEKAEMVKKGLMQRLFSEGIGHSDFKDSELGRIPESWKVKKIGSICDCIVPGRNKPIDFNGNIPWITTPDLDNKYISNTKNNLYISKTEAKKIGSKIVPINSIIMSCVGNLGILAITKNEIVINQQLHAFLPSKLANMEYLHYALFGQKKYMNKIATKTAVPYMNKDNCNSILVSLPPIKEQKKISTILTKADQKIEILKAKKEQYQILKTGLMQKLLTGEIGV